MQKTEIGSRYSLPKPEMAKQHPRSRREGAGTFTKTLLVVKLTILLLTAAFLNVHANSKAQTVTLSGKDLTLKQVFAAIEKQTDYLAFYNQQLLTNTKTVTLTVYDMPLADLLKTVLKDQPLDFTIQGKTIILSRKTILPDSKPENTIPSLITLFTPPVTGRVQTPDGQPLSGATISVKGSSKGTMTGNNGSFTISLNKGDIIEISSVGYMPLSIAYDGNEFKTVSTGNKQNNTNVSRLLNGSAVGLTILLARSNSPLDEVQIIAYGKTTKRMATGNVGTVTAEEIERQPVMTALEAIIAKVPGVEVRQLSGNAAAPMAVTIRGANSINDGANDPLYVIDGIPMNNLNLRDMGFSTGAVQSGATNTLRGENMLLSINPADIESISILKDADATAIYGSRGANGVILITTKKPKNGPATLSIKINNGTKSIPRYPNLLNTDEYLAIRREAFRNDGITPTKDNAPDLTIWDQTKYTNWQRAMIGTGSVTDINVDVSGGVRQTTYRLSAAYNTQKEIMNNGGKNKRGTFSSAINHSSSDQKFNFTLQNSLGLTEVNAYNLGEFGSIAPNAPDIYNARGTFNFEPYRVQGRSDFPFAGLKTPSESKTFTTQHSVNLSYELLRGLAISLRTAYRFTNNVNAAYVPLSAIDQAIIGNPFTSTATYGNSSEKNLEVSPQIAYKTVIGKGSLNVQFITGWQSGQARSTTTTAVNFPNDAMLKSFNNAASSTTAEAFAEYKYLSAAAIIRYDWDRKYIISLNGRRDGSSRFGPGKQFGNFGSIGLAWIASDEPWLQSILPSWITLLKFRGSYGIMGSDASRDYEYLSRWSKASTVTNTARSIYPYNGITAFHVLRPLNQQFQWEANKKSEVAASVSFLQDRINLEIALYSELSGNQLANVNIPQVSGFKNTLSNWPAEVRNSGIELSANAKLVQTNNWGLNLGFNIGRNRNKLVAFPGLDKNLAYNGRFKTGYSTTTEFVLRYTGIDPLTGSYTFEDYNKDGVITTGVDAFPTSNADDRYLAIDNQPKYSGGFFLGINYKAFSLNTGFSFTNKLRIDPYMNTVPGSMRNFVLADEIRDNHWQNPGDIVQYPRYTTSKTTLGPIHNSDAYYTSGSIVRLNNLAASWRLPAKWINKVKLKNASLSIYAQNLFVLSPYKGLDPDISSFEMTTPIPRTITTNLSFTF